MMVGDRFDTDVRAGLSAGFLTCLVTSGCHAIEAQPFYRTDPAHHYASDVGGLVPIDALEAAHAAVCNLRDSLRVEGEDQVAVLTAAFHAVDADDSGGLDRDELRVLMANLGAAETTDAELEELIHAADEDGNGTIELSEFLVAMNAAPTPPTAEEAIGSAARVAPASTGAAMTSGGEPCTSSGMTADPAPPSGLEA